MIKTMGTAYARDDFSKEEFMAYWLDTHAAISAKAPGLRGYVVSEVVEKVQGDLQSHAFVEQWYDSPEAFYAAADSPEGQAAWDDVSNYAKTSGTFWIVKEHVIVPPPDLGPGLIAG